MNQYVGLLELISESSSIPTAEVLQDVSVLYARLGENIQIAVLLSVSVSPICQLPSAATLSTCSLLSSVCDLLSAFEWKTLTYWSVLGVVVDFQISVSVLCSS